MTICLHTLGIVAAIVLFLMFATALIYFASREIKRLEQHDIVSPLSKGPTQRL